MNVNDIESIQQCIRAISSSTRNLNIAELKYLIYLGKGYKFKFRHLIRTYRNIEYFNSGDYD